MYTPNIYRIIIMKDLISFFLQAQGVNLLSFKIRQPDKYALALLDALFTEQELAGSCY